MLTLDIGAAMQQMGEMEDELTAHEGCRLHGDVAARYVAGKLQFGVHQGDFLTMLPQMLTGHLLPQGGALRVLCVLCVLGVLRVLDVLGVLGVLGTA